MRDQTGVIYREQHQTTVKEQKRAELGSERAEWPVGQSTFTFSLHSDPKTPSRIPPAANAMETVTTHYVRL